MPMHVRFPPGFAIVSPVVVALIGTSLLTGCTEPEPVQLEKIYKTAATSSAAAQATIVSKWTAGEITMQGALGLAHDRLDTQRTANSVAFAAAVLGAEAQLEGAMNKKAELNEFFWMRTGTLAADAAAVAWKLGDIPGARAVVLAGPKRWQTEAYWLQNPAHDAMASYILHASGETGEALNRLRGRPDMAEEVQRAVEEIERAARAGKK